MSRISVLIPDADVWPGLLVAHCLRESDRIILHGLSARKVTPIRYSNLFATIEFLPDELRLDRWLKRIDEVVLKRQIDVVMPISDLGIRALSEHRNSLTCAAKLVHLPEPHVFDIATNKASLSTFLTDRGIPQPATVVVASRAATSECLSALRFPVLAKPPLSSGGNGIRRIENLQSLTAFLDQRRDGEVWVLQEFVQGFDLGVNVLCRDGEVIATNGQHELVPSLNPYEPAKGVSYCHSSSAMTVARRLVAELGWSGVANIDMRYDTERRIPLMLEVNGRYWTSLLGSLNAGLNYPLLACEALLKIPLSNRQARAGRYFKGMGNVAVSLFGGGRLGIRPSETNLRFFLRDPIPFVSPLVTQFSRAIAHKLRSKDA